MIDEEIRKYILDGKWENQYRQTIEYLLAENMQLREGIEQLYESIGTIETQGNIAIRKALKELIK